MGFLKTLLFITLIIIAIAHFFPNQYEDGRDWVWDTANDQKDNLLGSNDSRSQTLETTLNDTFSRGEQDDQNS